MSRTRTLAILVRDDVEVLDFCGPFEVFSVASRFTEPPAFTALTVAENAGSVLTRGGLSVNPHHRLADCPQPDVLLVPGSQGTRKEMHNPALIEWIKQASTKAELVLSVCTGALLLAKAGLLDGLETTTHHGAIDLLRHLRLLQAGRCCYLFFACLDWILPFCNFFRRLGNLVAGFLAIRLSFFAIPPLLSIQVTRSIVQCTVRHQPRL